ncbi:MAG: carbon monoxide dehydrogenase, medium subunit [Paucimonas sp.]|nr:carbon monoxide dehydrogenase, medium subunit [Paucimonas sp.]
MRDFEFLRPASAAEASQMLATHGEGALPLAGGTALLLALRQRLVTPSHVVNLGGLPDMDQVRFDAQTGLRIGALVTIAELALHPVIAEHYPMLSAMAKQVANPQVRSMATLGGNLCYADPATDPPTCLMAMGARVRISGSQGERELALEEFYIDYYQTDLKPAELVTEILLPPPAAIGRGAYTRFVKTAAEHRPLVGVGICAHGSEGRFSGVRVCVGASTVIPSRARQAEASLEGQPISRQAIADMARIAAAELNIISDFRGDEAYRRHIVGVVVERTCTSLFEQLL